jgi:SPP1 family predicted phage head-tail adaptor
MDASQLREWIAIFQMELTPDGQGGFRESIPAGLVADVPAKVETPSGAKVWAADQLGDRVTRDITIRYQPGISTVYRIMWRNEYLDVRDVKNVDARDTWLRLACERKEAGVQ